MSLTLELPVSAQSREKADILLDKSRLSGSLSQQSVVIDARATKHVSASFADQLVSLLANLDVSDVTLIQPSEEFIGYLKSASRNRRFHAIKFRSII
jgi:hypothetical protein